MYGVTASSCMGLQLRVWDYSSYILHRQQVAPTRCAPTRRSVGALPVICQCSAGALPECGSCSWVETWQYAAAVAAGLLLVGMLQKSVVAAGYAAEIGSCSCIEAIQYAAKIGSCSWIEAWHGISSA